MEVVRYLVIFMDCDTELYYSTLEEADHTARTNAGTIIDLVTGKIVSKYA